MRWHIAANHGASPDHRALTNSYVRQNDAVRSNEHILLNHNLPVSDWSSRAGVKVGNDRCSEADDAVVAYTYVLWVDLVEVDKLTDPDILSDRDSSQPL